MHISLWIGLGVLALIAVLILTIWSIRRHRDPDLCIECDETIDKLVPSLAGLTLGTAVRGNSVEVVQNGAFWDVLIESINSAQKSVHFETFLWKEGQLGTRMAKAFADRARAGVKVRVLLDGNGCQKIGQESVDLMRDAGAKVKIFHKTSLRNLGVLNDRDHRKLAVIDGREAFVGGHCVVDEWLGDAEDGKHFSDVSVRLRGPIVNSIQGAFSENWVGTSGEIFVGEAFFPEPEQAGDVQIHAVFAKPENSAPTIKILHHTAICLARKRIWIQNPYFIPEAEAIKAFGEAVKRGVDVRVLMPSTGGSDNPMVQHAGHRNFAKLLKLGVRLFEYPHTLLHQKIMTIDGVWSAIGSSNFDSRSFETNDEITLAISDENVTRQLDAVFERYVKRAEEVDLERWKKRSLWLKAKEQGFYFFHELL